MGRPIDRGTRPHAGDCRREHRRGTAQSTARRESCRGGIGNPRPLHPAGGQSATHFAHLKEGGLKRILKMRFDEAKDDRAKAIGRGVGGTTSAPDWTADLILDKNGAIRPVLANLIRFLRWHPAWQGVLGFDEFHARVVIRKSPPWGAEAVDAPWVDHHENQTRVWLQHEDLSFPKIISARSDDSVHPRRAQQRTTVPDRWIARCSGASLCSIASPLKHDALEGV
jgi:hypothetical protein